MWLAKPLYSPPKRVIRFFVPHPIFRWLLEQEKAHEAERVRVDYIARPHMMSVGYSWSLCIIVAMSPDQMASTTWDSNLPCLPKRKRDSKALDVDFSFSFHSKILLGHRIKVILCILSLFLLSYLHLLLMSSHYTVISEVFIGDPVDFRRDIFQYWLRGCSVEEAVTKLKTNTIKIEDPMESMEDLVQKDVQDSVDSRNSCKI